jgi:hypothetical protein
VSLFTTFSDVTGTGYPSYLSAPTVGSISNLFTPTAASSLTVLSAITNGRALPTTMITTTYDSLHHFLLRGIGDTMLFQGFTSNDTSLFGVTGALTLPITTGNGTMLPTPSCVECYQQCMQQFVNSQIGDCIQETCLVACG